MRTRDTGEDGPCDGGDVGTRNAALRQIQILTDDRDELQGSRRHHVRPLHDMVPEQLQKASPVKGRRHAIAHVDVEEGGQCTGAAANVDMKLVKKHSQLMWKDLRSRAAQ